MSAKTKLYSDWVTSCNATYRDILTALKTSFDSLWFTIKLWAFEFAFWTGKIVLLFQDDFLNFLHLDLVFVLVH
jgi:hypothetical protein